MHGDHASLAVQSQELGRFVTVVAQREIPGTAVRTLVRERMPDRNQLWHRRYLTLSQAATTDYELAQLVQQPIADIVFGD
jgi:hypothetical protein